jgi:Uma2 family endonuclease
MTMISNFDQLDLSKRYSYADYLTWRFKERVELFRGWVQKMSPAPGRRHQEVTNRINVSLFNYLDKKQCQVYVAPFDVVLDRSGADTVVQPDVCVVCDLNKLTDQGCSGAPDLMVEVLSPGNSSKEKRDKFDLYQENGVREYWIVSLQEETIYAYDLNEQGVYVGRPPFIQGMTLSSSAVSGFSLDVSSAFA